MGFIAKLLGRRAKAAVGHRGSRLAALTRDQTRKELLALAVRDTLKKHGVPAGTIVADALASGAQGRPDGVHLVLVFREWNPRLLPHLLALEQTVLSRLFRSDPLSNTWLLGVSWRLPSVRPSAVPRLPRPAEWAAEDTAVRDRPAARQDVETVLRRGDAAFAKRSQAGDDFSPTLPLERQPVQAAA